MAYTLDTTLGTLLNDPKAKAILDQYLPGVTNNPMVALAKGMSLKTVLAMPQAKQLGLTEVKAKEILAEINKEL
jgi:hypothetical protein